MKVHDDQLEGESIVEYYIRKTKEFTRWDEKPENKN